jgi:hypothetical protein
MHPLRSKQPDFAKRTKVNSKPEIFFDDHFSEIRGMFEFRSKSASIKLIVVFCKELLGVVKNQIPCNGITFVKITPL